MLTGTKNTFWKNIKTFSKEKYWIAAMTRLGNGLEEIRGEIVEQRLQQKLEISWEVFEAKMFT